MHHSCCIVSFTPSLAPPYTIYVEPRQNHDSPGDLKFVKKSRFARTVEGPGEWTSHITSAKRHLNIISTSRIMWNRRSSSAGFFVSSLRFSDELLPFRSRLCFLRLRQSCSEACHIYCHKYPLASVSHGGGQASFGSSRTTYSTPGQRPR